MNTMPGHLARSDYLVVRDLWKRYGDFAALKNINLEIGEGNLSAFSARRAVGRRLCYAP